MMNEGVVDLTEDSPIKKLPLKRRRINNDDIDDDDDDDDEWIKIINTITPNSKCDNVRRENMNNNSSQSQSLSPIQVPYDNLHQTQKDADDDDDKWMKRTNTITPNSKYVNLHRKNINSNNSLQIESQLQSQPLSSGLVPYDNLHQTQKEAIDAAKLGHNIFITGPGGTGKSVILSHIIEHLNQKYKPEEFAILATTGIAAVPLNGQTIHSFAGCGIPDLVIDFDKCWGKKDEWRKLKVMVIDEISMASGEFLDHLHHVVSRIRSYSESEKTFHTCIEDSIDYDSNFNHYKEYPPFGGIQLIFSGDFLQLPFIPRSIQDIRLIVSLHEKGHKKKFKAKHICRNLGFAFQSHLWNISQFQIFTLSHVFRQKSVKFQSILAEIRLGKVSQESEAFLNQCCRPLSSSLGDTLGGIKIQPTILYPRNVDVKSMNENQLMKLDGISHFYPARDSIHVDADAGVSYYEANSILKQHTFWNNCIAEEEVKFKVNAQVMLIKNKPDRTLVNGSRGVVIAFAKEQKCDICNALYSNNDSKHFEYCVCCVEDKDNNNRKNDVNLVPVVKFKCGITLAIEREDFTYKMNGVGTCVRNAIPLKLAWAITVHKSQGMSIDYVKADLTHVFTEAQTYVALSRVTDENGLELSGFSPKVVKASAKAIAYYQNPHQHFPHWSQPWELAEQDDDQYGDIRSSPNSNNDLKTGKKTYSPCTPNVYKNTKAKESSYYQDPSMDHITDSKNTNYTIPTAKPGCLQGLAFVFTGELQYTSRDDAESLVKACGGLVRSAVSGKINYLVIGDSLEDGRAVHSGVKYKKAKEIINSGDKSKSGLRILNECDCYELGDCGELIVGKPLVAKESRFVVEHDIADKHTRKEYVEKFCRTQQLASRIASEFNKKLDYLWRVDDKTPRVKVLDCSIYDLNGENLGWTKVLVEEKLDHEKWFKWNSNNGYVAGKGRTPNFCETKIEEAMEKLKALDLEMCEIIEEGEEDEDESEVGSDEGVSEKEDVDYTQRIQPYTSRDRKDSISFSPFDVAQAFSHFSYWATGRKRLICDLQGVFDEKENVLKLSDPVIHYRSDVSKSGRMNVHGRTDKGRKGFAMFFDTHECNYLCNLTTRGFKNYAQKKRDAESSK